MKQATELVDIHLVMADKEFDRHGVYHVLDQRHEVDYLIPKKEDSKHLREQVAEVREDDAVTARVRARMPHCIFVMTRRTSTSRTIPTLEKTTTVTT